MKIGVCSLTIGEEYKKNIKWCKESLERYCKMYDYPLITDESVYVPERSPPWSKIKLVQKYLKEYDYLIWIDADVMIMNYGRRLEEFINLIEPDKFLLICQGGGYYTNSGVFIIKNCEESFRFLKEVWETPSFEGDDRDCRICSPWEQRITHKIISKYNAQIIPHSFGNILNSFEPHFDDIIHWLPGDFNIHFCGIYNKELEEKQLEYCNKSVDDPHQGFEFLRRYKLLVKSQQLHVEEKVPWDNEYFDPLDFKIKKEDLTILLPVGVGDALMVNGLVRYFAETYNIILGVACWNSKNVKYFFRDLQNIQYLETVEGSSKRAAEQLPEMANGKKLILGYWRQIGTRPIEDVGNEPSDLSNWVRKIYEEDAKIPETIRYSKFYAQREPEREEAFYQRVIQYLGTTDYIVISESHEKLDRLRIPEKCKIFCMDKGVESVESDLVMDYCKVIERSQAFHGPDCGWAWLIEMLDLRVPKRYMHQYPPCARFHFDSIDFPEDYFKSGKWTVFRKQPINVTKQILVPMDKSELIDRISILEIKLERISDPSKRDHVVKELKALERITDDRNIKLKAVNTILWNVEDELRIKEQKGEFDSEFIWLARLVYTWNDRRHEFKKDSDQKQHTNYQKKKTELFILAPLGFGDALVINGLIRDLAERYDIIFGIEEYYHKNIHYMFRDLPNIRYILSNDKISTDFKNQLAEKGNALTCEKMYLGYMKQLKDDPLNKNVGYNENRQEGVDWARNMYRDANLNPDIMFEKFFVLRDRWKEETFYRQVIEHLGTTDYVVIHDCDKRGPVDRKKVPETHKVFLLGKGASPVESDCIFDYRMVIEKAQAYHGPDGGFSWFVEMCKINVPKKYLHIYPPLHRPNDVNFPNGYYRSEWTVLS
jgi:hypothetical protein